MDYFFLLRRNKNFLLNDNPNHLKFLSTLKKFNCQPFKQNKFFNKILKDKNKKYCFNNFFSKSVFFKTTYFKNFASNSFFTEFFKNYCSQSNFQKTFYNDSFYFIFKNYQVFCLKNRKQIFNFKQLKKFLQKKWYKDITKNQLKANLKSILIQSQKDMLFIQHIKDSFFIKIFLEKIVVFLLKYFNLFNKLKFKETIHLNQIKLYLQNWYPFKKEFSFKGFSVFLINSNFDFFQNQKLFKKSFFSLKILNKFCLYIRRKIILLPLKKEIKKHLKNLKKIIYNNFSQSQKRLLLELKLQIINWSFKYRIINRPEIFVYCDNILKKFLWKWVCRIHVNKSKYWIKKKYFVLLKNKILLFRILSNSFFLEKSLNKFVYLPRHFQFLS